MQPLLVFQVLAAQNIDAEIVAYNMLTPLGGLILQEIRLATVGMLPFTWMDLTIIVSPLQEH